MSINWMSECVEAACERWLASSFACCAPKLLAEKAGPQGMLL